MSVEVEVSGLDYTKETCIIGEVTFSEDVTFTMVGGNNDYLRFMPTSENHMNKREVVIKGKKTYTFEVDRFDYPIEDRVVDDLSEVYEAEELRELINHYDLYDFYLYKSGL